MTKIAIVPNAAGTGTFTIEAPNSNSNRTLVLPDAAGELLTDVSGLPAANLTGDVAAARITNALNATGSAPVYACRAWVNFNGTGTVAIRASGNVSSITKDATGSFRVNFTTSMQDMNYVVNVSAAFSDQYAGYHIGCGIGHSSTSSARVWGGWTGGPVDLAWMQVSVFR
jgi:hypothetical protein